MAEKLETTFPNIKCLDMDQICNGFVQVLGEGCFGASVFKGEWRCQDVAVKKISSTHDMFHQKWHNFRQINAENILTLLECSLDSYQEIAYLLYQYMPNGSVFDRLLEGNPYLSWIQKGHIVSGATRGLAFLHSDCIYHGNVKSTNILLDKHFEPKIADFGMIANSVSGSPCYMPYEIKAEDRFNEKTDIFSFGIILFELFTGIPPSTKNHCKEFWIMRKFMEDWVDDHEVPWSKVDQKIPCNDILGNRWAKILFKLGKNCINGNINNAMDLLLKIQFEFEEKPIWFAPYKCLFCCKLIQSPKEREVHHENGCSEKSQSESIHFQCTSCSERFENLADRKKHFIENHFGCGLCGRKFKDAKARNQHFQTKHGCNTCPLKYQNNTEYYGNICKFPCVCCKCSICETQYCAFPRCDQSFQCKSSKENHEKKHCLICEEVFLDEDLLSYHMKLIHFRCNLCWETFENENSTMEHFKEIHQCENCNEAFPVNAEKLTHLKNSSCGICLNIAL